MQNFAPIRPAETKFHFKKIPQGFLYNHSLKNTRKIEVSNGNVGKEKQQGWVV
jgi:hypothetical protein